MCQVFISWLAHAMCGSLLCNGLFTLAKNGPERGQKQGPGRMDCMILCRTFHTARKQGLGPEQAWGEWVGT